MTGQEALAKNAAMDETLKILEPIFDHALELRNQAQALIHTFQECRSEIQQRQIANLTSVKK